MKLKIDRNVTLSHDAGSLKMLATLIIVLIINSLYFLTSVTKAIIKRTH